MKPTDSKPLRPTSGKGKSTLMTLLAIVLILVSALAVGAYIVKSAPQAKRQKPIAEAPLVTTEALTSSTEQVQISAMGTVVPASELDLKVEVSGRVVKVRKNFEIGSRVASGEMLLELETADYQAALAKAQSDVATAAFNLAIEEGNQEIARQEWALYDGKGTATTQDRELALRQPHLLKTQAEYRAAQAELRQAELDLQRTRLSAPFNALVISKTVEPGSYLSAQNSIATLVDTDRYWVQVSVPVDRLDWILLPQTGTEQGSRVAVHIGNKQRVGTVHRLLGDLAENGRMARLLVEVSDPLDLQKPAGERQPLLLGEYARVEIDGKTLSDVISIPRSALHDGDQLWLLDEQQKLQIVTVEVLWRDSDRVLLKNTLPDSVRLVTSNLGTAVDGMQLRAAEPDQGDSKGKESGDE